MPRKKIPKKYSVEDLRNAVAAFKAGKTMAEGARMFNIPRSTLYNKLSGRYALECSAGPRKTLSDKMESELVEWILECADAEQPRTREQILDNVQLLCVKLKLKNRFTGGRPGKVWFNDFMKRHPVLKLGRHGAVVRALKSEENIQQNLVDMVSESEAVKLESVITTEGSKVFIMDPDMEIVCKSENESGMSEEEDRLKDMDNLNDEETQSIASQSTRRQLLIKSIWTSVKFHLDNEKMSDDDLVKFHCDLLQYIHQYFKEK